MNGPQFGFIERKRAEREDDERFTTSLAAFAATLLLGLIAFYVMEGLAATGKLEDCLLQGRTNCERIESALTR